MDLEYLLQLINELKIIKIHKNIIEEMMGFKSTKEVVSLFSLALKLDGHQPIKDFCFDIKKFEKWINENNLCYFFDEQNRIYHIKHS